jgi:phosphoribosylformimino-5-aminoimidazole carboxamide ribotide isomerase
VQQLAELSRRQPKLIGAIIGRALYEGTLTVEEALAAAK